MTLDRRQLLGGALMLAGASRAGAASSWRAGVARVVITPEEPLFLAGYGTKRPSEGKRHDLWVKALALEDGEGRRAVLVTSDLVGVSKEMYERLVAAVGKRHRLGRDRLLLTYTHNHCAPVTTDVLPDYYPLEPDDWRRVDAYTRWLEDRILMAIDAAFSRLTPATLAAGEGERGFAVNRRNNREAEVAALLAAGKPLKGPVDHTVPVLAVRRPNGRLLAVVFGYACHPTTVGDHLWNGDYPGYAQEALERAHPRTAALFWTGCGGDQNPLPRRTPELCAQYGRQLADAVEATLAKPLRPLAPELRTAFTFVRLDFDRRPTRAEVEVDTRSSNPVLARWARRMLSVAGSRWPPASLEHSQPSTPTPPHSHTPTPGTPPRHLATHCDYGVQAWRLGDQLWIALGGEAVVDYALRFRREYGRHTWTAGYAHDMVGYVPSRRVWDEGGYEAEFIHEYGWLAHRWTADTEDRIAAAVAATVAKVRPGT